jgi:hypothetical protein
VSGRGQRETQLGAHAAQKNMRNLDQDPGAIAGILLAATGPAMHEVPEYRQRVRHDSMRTTTLYIHDETDAAGVVLISRVIKTLLHVLVTLFQFRLPVHLPLAVIFSTNPLCMRRSTECIFCARRRTLPHFKEYGSFATGTFEKR